MIFLRFYTLSSSLPFTPSAKSTSLPPPSYTAKGRVNSPGQLSSTNAMSSFATRTPRFGPPKSRPPNSIRFPGCSLLLSRLGRLI
ncbi:hypothetical protein CMV_026677 [Castanea mollissima]|uniref:Uncharacterized protein n=1 Tax=Castanea mollissima TaxID=60419 RepID=A0A8J4QL99_9ROSI|nr:hypothetical protein CMV_026677 [Castanea mollissima]